MSYRHVMSYREEEKHNIVRVDAGLRIYLGR